MWKLTSVLPYFLCVYFVWKFFIYLLITRTFFIINWMSFVFLATCKGKKPPQTRLLHIHKSEEAHRERVVLFFRYSEMLEITYRYLGCLTNENNYIEIWLEIKVCYVNEGSTINFSHRVVPRGKIVKIFFSFLFLHVHIKRSCDRLRNNKFLVACWIRFLSEYGSDALLF